MILSSSEEYKEKLKIYINKINNKNIAYTNIFIDDEFENSGTDFIKTRLESPLDSIKFDYIITNFSDNFCKILLDTLSKDGNENHYIVIKYFEFHTTFNPINNTYDNCLVTEFYTVKKKENIILFSNQI